MAVPSRAELVSSIIRASPCPAFASSCGASANASASENSISAEATDFVPSLSFNRRIRTPLREPSRRSHSTRNGTIPRTPSGAPSGLASTTNADPLALDANHFKPLSFHASPSRTAVASSAPKSEPPARSVSICAASPVDTPAAKISRTRSRTSSGANLSARLTTISAPVPSAQPMPTSAWYSR